MATRPSRWKAQHVDCQKAVDNVKADLTKEIERLTAQAEMLRFNLDQARIEARDALQELIPFAEEHVRLSYRDADVPQMLADPVLKRARAVLEG